MPRRPAPPPTLGAVIRRRRLARETSLRRLASASGVSPSFMSQVENDRTRPSIGTLHRIARALDATAQALLAETSAPAGAAVTVSRAGRGATVQHDLDPADGVVRSVAVGAGSPFHAMDITGAPAEFGDPYEHDGHELLFVIDGPVEVDVAGERHRLDSGDSITYPATLPHQTRRLGDGTRILIVTVDV